MSEKGRVGNDAYKCGAREKRVTERTTRERKRQEYERERERESGGGGISESELHVQRGCDNRSQGLRRTHSAFRK